jgi:hypothetical protein
MNKKVFVPALAALLVLVAIWWATAQPETGTLIQDPSSQEGTSEATSQVNIEDRIIQLQAVAPYEGSGTARRNFREGVFSHVVIADIGDPAPGKFYEGWLVDKEPTLRFFSTGKLEKRGDRYVLAFTADQNYLDHNNVVITEETESLGLDGTPEAHVLEGSFSE